MPGPSRTRSRNARARRTGATALVRNTFAASSREARRVVSFRRRDPGVDEDEVEDLAVEPLAHRGDRCIVVDVDMLDPDRAAGFRRQFLQPPLAGLVAHRRDDIPAPALQFRRQPQPEPARRADHQRQAWISHHRLRSLSAAPRRLCFLCYLQGIYRCPRPAGDARFPNGAGPTTPYYG